MRCCSPLPRLICFNPLRDENRLPMKKHLAILGSTGTIGCKTLKIVERFRDRFSVTALAAAHNLQLLARQIQIHDPQVAVTYDAQGAEKLRKLVPESRVKILFGEAGYRAAVVCEPVDMVVGAMVGAAGLMPTLTAIEAGKDIALANKETLVMAGEIVMRRAAEKGVRILPIDSEHSAIFQCLKGHRRKDLSRIHLTASGGPLLNRPLETFKDVAVADALNHPTWRMGKKISIDSATLMNKGLEVIEAKHLFSVPRNRIDVVIHPQSIVHSMVSYRDGSMIAQMGVPDMTAAIAYALSYPRRLSLGMPLPDLAAMALTFQPPDLEKFPCLKLAFEACDTGGTLPAVLNAANEMAVEAFLNERIGFCDIAAVIRRTLSNHSVIPHPELSDILHADAWARNQAQTIILEKKSALGR